MSSVRQVADRFDEFKRNGFDDEQARVIATAIDETVEDRLKGVVAPIVARLDRIEANFKVIDTHFKAIDTRFAGIESQIKGLGDRLSSRKFEIAALVMTSSAALIGIGLAAYEYGIKPLLGLP